MKHFDPKEFFGEAMEFISQRQSPETILSAVVHLDEEYPHMHLCFVPLTKDKRLCAMEIVGNKRKLIEWQDRFFEHISQKYSAEEIRHHRRNLSEFVTDPFG